MICYLVTLEGDLRRIFVKGRFTTGRRVILFIVGEGGA
jgi:hypothetical protein